MKNLLALATTGLLAAHVATAQQDDRPLHLRGAEVRLPSEMHPDLENALVVVGVEQGGNEFRSRTPSLRYSDRRRNLIDSEKLRQRRLSLYAGQTYHAEAPIRPSNARPEPAPKQLTPEAVRKSSNWTWIGGLVLLGIGLIWLRSKRG